MKDLLHMLLSICCLITLEKSIVYALITSSLAIQLRKKTLGSERTDVDEAKLEARESIHCNGGNASVRSQRDKREKFYITTQYENTFDSVTSRSGNKKVKSILMMNNSKYMSSMYQHNQISYYFSHQIYQLLQKLVFIFTKLCFTIHSQCTINILARRCHS